MRVAIVDLGTNTFNLLIAEVNEKKEVSILLSEKLPVKISEGALVSNQIQPIPYKRGLSALKKHKQTIEAYKVEKIAGFATSAIRSTSNGKKFIDDVKQQIGLSIEIISGEKEAELIFSGIKKGVKWQGPALMMDIGGGSTEFIVSKNGSLDFAKSYDLGVSRIKQKFKFSDPIREDEVNRLNGFLSKQLSLLSKELSTISEFVLIGSAGTFDTLLQMQNQKVSRKAQSKPLSQSLSIDDFQTLHQYLVNSNQKERLANPYIPDFRAEMIVLGSCLVSFIVNQYNISSVIQSEYSLKEGAIFELIKN